MGLKSSIQNLQSKINSVAMVVFCFADGDHAAVGDFADGVFELDRGVIDFEVVMQAFFDVAQDLFTFGRWNVGDGDVAGKSARFRSDVPDVQIVNVVHAVDLLQAGFDHFQL